MKKTRSILVVLVILCMLAANFPAAGADGTEDCTKTFGWTQMTTSSMQVLYRSIYQAVKNFEFSITLPKDSSLSAEEIQTVMQTVMQYMVYDVPELFCFGGGYAIGEGPNDIQLALSIQYNNKEWNALIDDKEEYAQALAALRGKNDAWKAAAQTVIAGASQYGEEKDIAAYVYHYLRENVSYDHECANNLMNNVPSAGDEYGATIYGALVEHSAICAGYAKAYAYILNTMGIQTWIVCGKANTGAKMEDHAWCVSWYDGVCVYTDPTWNSTDQYLNISGNQMNKDHTPSAEYAAVLGSCDHSQYAAVQPEVKATAVTVNADSCSLTQKGETYQIQASVVPSNATNQSVSFTSENSAVATVSPSGLVTAVSEGETRILVTSGDGAASTTVTVKVNLPGHVHSLQKVEAKAPSCQEDGNTEYYHCSGCGASFADAGGKTPVSADSVTIPASHDPVYQYDDEQHWTRCGKCGELSEKEDHVFAENETTCFCGYVRELSGETQPASDPTESTTEPGSDPTEGTMEPASDPTESTTEPGSDPTESTTESIDPTTEASKPAEDDATEATVPTPGETKPTEDGADPAADEKGNGFIGSPLFYLCVCSVIAAAAVAGAVLFRKRKT